MKRTYQLTIEMPDSFDDVPDWKVEQLIAGQIEEATITRKGDPTRSKPLKVTKVDHIATEKAPDPIEDLSSFIGILFGSGTR